jgi:hypothetical protein
VTDDTATLRELGANHLLDFSRTIAPMRPGGDEDGDIFSSNARHLGEQRLEHQPARLRPRDVAHRDADSLPRPRQRSQGRFADGRRDGPFQSFQRVSNRRNRHRFDHGGSVARQVHRQTIAAVVQFQSHVTLITQIESWVARLACRRTTYCRAILLRTYLD